SGDDPSARWPIRNLCRNSDCVALARRSVSISWFNSDLVTARDFEIVPRASTNAAIPPNDRAVADPDELSSLASNLLLAGRRTCQQFLLRRAARAHGSRAGWLRSARAYAKLRLVCRRV